MDFAKQPISFLHTQQVAELINKKQKEQLAMGHNDQRTW